MTIPRLLADLIAESAARAPAAIALVDGERRISYGDLWQQVQACAGGLTKLGLARGERVAVYLDKRIETVVACFGATHAGAAFVPVNPLLKAAQVQHILRDCNVRVLVTSRERYELLIPILATCPGLRCIVSTNGEPVNAEIQVLPWATLLDTPAPSAHGMPDTDIAAIFYTSGSTGKPKGVVLSHRNFVVGATSVAGYLENNADDVLLAALPLSFDAGFSQLTTAFHAGASVVLLNYLLPRDVLIAMQREHVTGLTAVPPLYIQLAQLEWPSDAVEHLRYYANTGGRLPQDTLSRLRTKAPLAKPFLMYGLTEAFRSTYLPPEEVDRRPDSIGRAIPNVDIFVLRPDGALCNADEPGELVHVGPLVSKGYWNKPDATAERFRPLPPGLSSRLAKPGEAAVYSGDSVRRDAEGFLYFVGRRDEMIKTSGYRVSPTEVEEALYATNLVGECIAFGVPHPVLGQAIHVIATPAKNAKTGTEEILAACRAALPAYMVPATIALRQGSLPRTPNGKIDRKGLQSAG
jgi:acyl-CoA ligase (AMP-forming) (exosortase A-associated)